MNRLLVFVRSLLYTFLFFLSVLVFGFFIILPRPIMNEKNRWRLVGAFTRSNVYMCRALCGLDYDVIGLKNIPEKPCIVFIKHSSVYEMFFFLSFFQPASCLAKYELLFVPVLRGLVRTLKCIPVKRGLGKKEVNKVLVKGEQYLNEGRWIVVCPEGTRVPYGETRRYGISGALLAKGTVTPVLPVAHNAGYFWGRRSLIKKPGKITFSVGSQFTTEGLGVDEINKRAQDWIEKEIKSFG